MPASRRPEEAALEACVRAVGDLLGPVAQHLRDGAVAVAERLPLDDGVAPTATDVLDVAHPLALTVLADPRVLGSGFVADPALAVDATYLLAWWQGEARERIAESVALRRAVDYSTKEWYAAPVRSGVLHLTGPYVDYVCTDELVVTLTAPVLGTDGATLGVTGADLLAETVERELSGVLVAAGASLVNQDRIVVAGRPRSFPGDRVEAAAYDVEVACPGLPLRLLA